MQTYSMITALRRSRAQIIAALIPYARRELAAGQRLIGITRHILGLYHGCPGGRLYRRHLAENAYRSDASADVIAEAGEIAERAMAAAVQ